MFGRRVTRRLRRFLVANGDLGRYLRDNPDVVATGADPVAHWCHSGAQEGRPMPGVILDPSDAPSAPVRIRLNGRNVALRPDPSFPRERAFEALVGRYADGEAYLDANPDVRAAGLEPIDHWLANGMAEGRRMPGLDVLLRHRAPREGWERLRWRGEDVLVRVGQPLPVAVQQAIITQAQNEPALLATGTDTVASLRRIDALHLYDRDGIDLEGFLDDVARTTRHARTVVVADRLERLAQVDLPEGVLSTLAATAPRDLLLLITEEQQGAPAKVTTAVGAVHREAAVHLRQHLRPGVQPGGPLLTRLLHALAPVTVVRIDGPPAQGPDSNGVGR